MSEEPFIESCRRRVEEAYKDKALGSGSVGGCFGSILCHELHHGEDGNGLHFSALAEKWGIPVSILGELIWDHCKRLEPLLVVNHQKGPPMTTDLRQMLAGLLEARKLAPDQRTWDDPEGDGFRVLDATPDKANARTVAWFADGHDCEVFRLAKLLPVGDLLAEWDRMVARIRKLEDALELRDEIRSQDSD